MMRLKIVFISLALSQMLNAQEVLVDGLFDEWSGISKFEDPAGDGYSNEVDFTELSVYDTEDFIVIYFNTTNKINLQNESSITLILDLDNNLQTGRKINGVGAELVYNFGDRQGIYYYNNGSTDISHNHLNLITAPSVSSDQFEIMIDKRSKINGQNLFDSNVISIRIEDNKSNGDDFPDSYTGLIYDMKNRPSNKDDFNLTKRNSNVRLLSYNVEKDNLFDDNAETSYRKVLSLIDADIIAFQEIYYKSGEQTKDYVNSLLGSEIFPYADDAGADVIVLSKFPIVHTEDIDGNGVFFIDIEDKNLALFNIHFPCCAKDSERRQEVDAILRYIRTMKENPETYGDDNAIIIAGDTNFVGDNDQLNSILSGDIYYNNTYGPDFKPDSDNSDLSYAEGKTLGIPACVTWFTSSSYSAGRLDYIFYSDANIKIDKNYSLNTVYLEDQELDILGLDVFDTYNCSDHLPLVVDFKIDFSVATQDVNFQQMFPNPNPVNSYVNINNAYSGSLKVYNTYGVLIDHMHVLSNHRLVVTNYPSGKYHLQLKSNNKLSKGNIIVIN